MHVPQITTASSSDYIVLALRGQLPVAALPVNAAGWAEVPDVLRALKVAGHLLSRFEFERLIMSDPAQRCVMSADRRRIRAVLPQSVTDTPVAAAPVAVA